MSNSIGIPITSFGNTSFRQPAELVYRLGQLQPVAM